MKDAAIISERTSRPWLQLGLRHLILIMVVVATWMAVYVNNANLSALRIKYHGLRNMARELVVQDPTKIAIVSIDDKLDVSAGWNVYLPDDSYELCLATREIMYAGYPAEYTRVPLLHGRFALDLMTFSRGDVHRIEALRDDSIIVEKTETGDWQSSSGSSSTGYQALSKQYDGSAPIDLQRRQNMILVPGSSQSTQTPHGPATGVLLWIQKSKTLRVTP